MTKDLYKDGHGFRDIPVSTRKPEPALKIDQYVILTKEGCCRVLNGTEGMTFVVNSSYVRAEGGRVVAVRDYRYPRDSFEYQIWSLSPGDYR